MMRIGEAARRSGVSAKLVRYYESVGLLSPASRTATGYRLFDERNVHELRFIKRSRSLGFSIKQIDELLGLWRDTKRPSSRVRALAERHVQSVTTRMQAHRAIIRVLGSLIEACKGDDRPDCPILDDLSTTRSASADSKPRAGAKTSGQRN